MRSVAIAIVAVFLAGCASIAPWETPHQQNYAGITAWRVNPATDCGEGVELCYDCDGKGA